MSHGDTSHVPRLRFVIGHNLKEFRLDRGISRVELAKLMRVSHWKVARIEQGANPASIDYLEDVAKILRVPVGRLLEW